MPHHEDDDIAPDEIRRLRAMKIAPPPGDNNSDVNAIAARERNVMDQLQEHIMAWAEEKGWNQGLDERSFGDWMSLLHSEISEAYEDYRNHRKLFEVYYELDGDATKRTYTFAETRNITSAFWRDQSPRPSEAPVFKPCGIPIEMADLAIRMLHLAEFIGFNLFNMIEMKMEYNHRRAFRHGNKKV
jgi:hypothetical protein